jgi:AcrR family transcriptional regulator
MDKKIDLRIIKTKKNLYEGLITLMQEKRFEDIKVSDICQISLVNRSTFYDHFSDKYELLSSLIEDLRKELEETLEKSNSSQNPKEYYLEVIKLFLEHISENIKIYSSILKNNNEGIVMDIAYQTIIKDVEKNVTKNSNITTEIPSEIISKFYVSAVINVCIEYLKFPDKYPKEKILNYLDKLIPKEIY